MDTKNLSKDNATTDSEEVVGILIAISAVAKRLAKNIAMSEKNKKEKGGEYSDYRKKTQYSRP